MWMETTFQSSFEKLEEMKLVYSYLYFDNRLFLKMYSICYVLIHKTRSSLHSLSGLRLFSFHQLLSTHFENLSHRLLLFLLFGLLSHRQI